MDGRAGSGWRARGLEAGTVCCSGKWFGGRAPCGSVQAGQATEAEQTRACFGKREVMVMNADVPGGLELWEKVL